MKREKLTYLRNSAIVAGSGIGGGVMAAPYIMKQCGVLWGAVILLAAYFVTVVLHIMIADLALRSEKPNELLSVFKEHLFKGKLKKVWIWAFFILMLTTLCANLAAYVSGAGDILAALLNIDVVYTKLIYFFFAAIVVFFGFRGLSANQWYSVLVMLTFLVIMLVFSMIHISVPLSIESAGATPLLALFGMMMFSLSSIFSVPQITPSLKDKPRVLRNAIITGLAINALTIIFVCVGSLTVSEEVSKTAIINWSRALGNVIHVCGSLFIVTAMLTTYWSISLALSDMVKEHLRIHRIFCWLIATLPSLLLTFVLSAGFIDYMQIAGGAVAVIIAIMVIPAYRIAIKKSDAPLLLGRFQGSRALSVCIAAAYILMAVGSLISV
jgi:amino acid permease